MAGSTFLVMFVPGRDDRAFYKRLLAYVARRLGVRYVDLDASSHGGEKDGILNRVYRPYGAGGSILRKASVIRLSSTGNTGEVFITIIPCERRVTQVAGAVLAYQAGLEEPMIDFVVVADDAEDTGFHEKLTSLQDSLRSLSHYEYGEGELSSGDYYRLFALRRPRGVKLMFLVQGLKQQSIVAKHAIEDYVLFTHRDDLKELLEAMGRYPHSLRVDVFDTYAHKKLALLIAIRLCHTRIEELFLRSLSDAQLDELLGICDGLSTLYSIVSQLLLESV